MNATKDPSGFDKWEARLAAEAGGHMPGCEFSHAPIRLCECLPANRINALGKDLHLDGNWIGTMRDQATAEGIAAMLNHGSISCRAPTAATAAFFALFALPEE
jgi:hypothetical protein